MKPTEQNCSREYNDCTWLWCFRSQRLDHTRGTHYLMNYDSVTVSESSNGC